MYNITLQQPLTGGKMSKFTESEKQRLFQNQNLEENKLKKLFSSNFKFESTLILRHQSNLFFNYLLMNY